jgi:hypothetical protein
MAPTWEIRLGSLPGFGSLTARQLRYDAGMPMTLGAALAKRAGHAREIEQNNSRATAAARYQEGSKPPESAAELMERAEKLIRDQANLIARINVTNAATRTSSGKTITEALAKRDALRALHKMYAAVVDEAAGHRHRGFLRGMASELRELPGVDVAAVRVLISALALQIREVDGEIQQAGLTADLIE